MLNAVEMYLFQQALNAATSPTVKAWVIAELKKGDAAISNPMFKSVIQAFESFLAVPPA